MINSKLVFFIVYFQGRPFPLKSIAISSYFHKIYKFLPISSKFLYVPLFSFNLRFLTENMFFASTLFCASCFTSTGRPCLFLMALLMSIVSLTGVHLQCSSNLFVFIYFIHNY